MLRSELLLDWPLTRHQQCIYSCLRALTGTAAAITYRRIDNNTKMATFCLGRRSLSLLLLFAVLATVESSQQATPFRRQSTLPSFSDFWKLLAEHRESVNQVIDELSSLSPFSEEPDVLKSVKELLDSSLQISRNATECDMCKSLVRVIREFLDGPFVDFSHLQGLVTLICYEIMDPGMPEERKQEICNGSIALQGPHVATVIEATTPSRFCQFQNLCFEKYQGLSKLRPKSRTSRLGDAWRGLQSRLVRPKAADLIKVVQLTDIHIDVRYAQGSLEDCGLPICCLESYGQGNAGPYGDYDCNIPPRTVDLFLKKVANDIIPEFIIYTGDISGSRLWDETQQEILNCSYTLIKAISTDIPDNIKVYPCFGNHEMFPTNLYYKGLDDVKNLTDQLTEWWTPVAGFADDQIRTMKEAGYYSIAVRPGLRLICMNTNYMYTKDWYNVINHDNRTEVHAMIAFVENELEKARTNDEKVILIGHHPPNSGDYLVEFAHWHQDLVLQYADIIVLITAGHKHSDHFQLVPDKDGVAQAMVYLSTAITTGGRKNPAIRVYYLDPTTFSVVDYEQYYFDLTNVTGNTEPKIVKLYSAREEYSLPDLTVGSWSALVDRFESDDALLLKHLNHYYVNTRNLTSCDDECKRNHICSLRMCTYDSYLNCIETYDPTISSATILTCGWMYSFLAMLSVLACRLI